MAVWLGASAVEIDVATERRKQIAKGYDSQHDDKHDAGELAAAAYQLLFLDTQGEGCRDLDEPDGWIDELAASLRSDRRRRLVVAAALIVAEIERLDRRG